MAWNLNRILSVGRQVHRVVQQVQRSQQQRGGAGSPDHAGRGTSPRPPRGTGFPTTPGDRGGHAGRSGGPAGQGAGVGPEGQVLDYPGDFHGSAHVEYAPVAGREAGPGEVVWTWVPFEELDGRGKDRPVLIVGRQDGYLLGAQLTTRDRNNAVSRDRDYLDIGSGPWDSKGRPSEVKLDRILLVNPRDVRREGGVLSEQIFGRVAEALRQNQGWS
ncbi:type II toxin-antitoxin system PemK/MazF family toxin [Micrococcus terreus]|uniref:type II toxin-antitoxin system PemK/MazF family toxin n=1 Tax=Micrococcus terreus TaxID=574650 RepID=UPI002550F3D0|nr:type II toxin-antitoxin system PemK/MazF family toxin [Micrococcus terreus]MDK7700010.1 type II toxin-antitoxin system PemK/MazF family toxin [Micrococcus terreus]WOO98394.1 type II toxin-antitoxin system PemK/MazF family toxin [Micrococcus terreus]